MSETSPAPAGSANQPQVVPGLVMNHQFIKDMSFEVPGAPQIFAQLKGAPTISLNLDVGVQRLDEQQPIFEVTLSIRTEATEPKTEGSDGRRVFIAELAYAGVATLNGVPAEHIEPMLLIEVPRLLFPYARNILADVTRDGGFPPVLLQPIDFVALWQQRRAQAQAAANTPAGHA